MKRWIAGLLAAALLLACFPAAADTFGLTDAEIQELMKNYPDF